MDGQPCWVCCLAPLVMSMRPVLLWVWIVTFKLDILHNTLSAKSDTSSLVGVLACCPAPLVLGMHPTTLFGSGYHVWVQHAWVKAAHLDLFFIFNGLWNLIRAQHSNDIFFQDITRIPQYFLSIQSYYFEWNTTQNITRVKLYFSLSSPQNDKIHGS